MQRRLSSWRTLYFKLVMPLFATGLVGTAVVQLWRGWSIRSGGGAEPLPIWFRLLFTAIALGGWAAVARLAHSLCYVALTTEGLLAAGYLAEERIALADVELVTQLDSGWLPRVVLHLRRATRLGRRITFVPADATATHPGQYRVVGELRALVGAAVRASRAAEQPGGSVTARPGV